MPDGDIAEVVTDSRGEAWARWYTTGTSSWSAWWPIEGKPEAVALAGPYTSPGEAARIAEARARAVSTAVVAELDRRGVAGGVSEPEAEPSPDGSQDEAAMSTACAALVAVTGRDPDARSWLLLTAAGLAVVRL